MNCNVITILITIFLVTHQLYGADSNKKPSRPLTPYEQVLAGVIVLHSVQMDSLQEKEPYYEELLTNAEITHDQFRAWLANHREQYKNWFLSTELIELHLQQ